jgi:hypothetical protein
MRLWPASARWRWRGCSRGRSRAEREWVAVSIDGSGLLVCHDSTVNGDRNFTVLKGLTPWGVDPDDGLTCSSKRLQRTVTQNRHFNEQAEFVTRQGAHPDSCPRWRRSLSGPSCPRRGEYAGATGWVLMVGTTVSRVRSAGTVSQQGYGRATEIGSSYDERAYSRSSPNVCRPDPLAGLSTSRRPCRCGWRVRPTPGFQRGGELTLSTSRAWEDSKRSATGLRDEMSISDVRESGVLDAAVDPVRVVLDDEMMIVAAISGCKRMAVRPGSVRVVLGWRYHEARAGLRSLPGRVACVRLRMSPR